MNEKVDPLCCCEYFDLRQQRNHILLCCCNCEDLDESVESIISGNGIPQRRVQGFMSTLQDRLRIPWRGGARQISPDALAAIIALPSFLALATNGLWWTITTFALMCLSLTYFYYRCTRAVSRTKFFIVWACASVILQFGIFEYIVVPFLEIEVHENVCFAILLAGCLGCLWLVRAKAARVRRFCENESEAGECGRSRSGRRHYCQVCQESIPEKDYHCVWLDCCISHANRCPLMIALTLGIGALLYSANLTLTTVCHPYRFYKTILLPDDCSDVYDAFMLSISFVSALYSLGVSALFSVLLCYHMLLISLGFTGHEWRALAISAKVYCGLTSSRPYDRGLVHNWCRELCFCHRFDGPVCQY